MQHRCQMGTESMAGESKEELASTSPTPVVPFVFCWILKIADDTASITVAALCCCQLISPPWGTTAISVWSEGAFPTGRSRFQGQNLCLFTVAGFQSFFLKFEILGIFLPSTFLSFSLLDFTQD